MDVRHMPRWKQYLTSFGRVVSHPKLWRFLLQPSVRYIATWLVTLIGTGIGLYLTWTAFDDPSRADGNNGHVHIDFGGQYLMGRMLVTGHGMQLYHRDVQREVVSEAYPHANGTAGSDKSDAESLQGSFMVIDSDIGGPLYPPVNAFLYAPLGLLDPQSAYRCMQVINLILGFVCGWGLRQLSNGRVWWPIAAGFVMLYPGFNGSITLGQNATLTLTILIWGWVAIVRGRPGLGGAIWGLFVFKPVWALAFFLVPIATRRWRAALAMVATGVSLVLLSIPWVGLESWKHWRLIGEEAATTYKYDAHWIPLSRDLLGIPRRWLDFAGGWQVRRDDVATTVVGCAMLATVVGLTLAVAFLRKKRAQTTTGAAPAFILLGAWLSCFHFMYYDVLLSALPVFLLFTDPWRHLQPRIIAIATIDATEISADSFRYFQPRLFTGVPPTSPLLNAGRARIWVLNGLIPTLVLVLMATPFVLYHLLGSDAFGIPADTVLLIILWLWCGWLWLRLPEGADETETASWPYAPKFIQFGADVRGPHERLAHEDGANARRLQA